MRFIIRLLSWIKSIFSSKASKHIDAHKENIQTMRYHNGKLREILEEVEQIHGKDHESALLLKQFCDAVNNNIEQGEKDHMDLVQNHLNA